MPDDAGGLKPMDRAVAAMAALRAPASPRQRAIVIAGAVAALLILAAALHWLVTGRFQIATDNAYVRADISAVAAQVEGYVIAAPVAENAVVQAGDVILQIDPADYLVAVQRARARLSQARAELAAARANARAASGRTGAQTNQIRVAAADVAAAEAQAARAGAELERQMRLADEGFLSPTRLDALRADAAQAAAAAAAARAALSWQRSQAGVLAASGQQAGGDVAAAAAAVEAAQAELDAAELDLARTRVVAPISGVVANRVAQVGQLVRPGAQIMAIVPHDVFVEANFKETQIARMRPGQRVRLTPDIDHAMAFDGVIESLSPATGAEFAFIPVETATGNFTKIVQRVPVRVRITLDEAQRAVIRPGLSVKAVVDTRTP